MFSVGIKFIMEAHSLDPNCLSPWSSLNLPAAVGDSELTVPSRIYTPLLLYLKVLSRVWDLKPSKNILNQLGMGKIG